MYRYAYLISIWKFCDRSAARLVVGDDPRTFNEKYSLFGFCFCILRSLKLKEPGPKPFETERCVFLSLGAKACLQFHGMKDGGCIAARGEEACTSMLARQCAVDMEQLR
jgi:hypothetical protein